MGVLSGVWAMVWAESDSSWLSQARRASRGRHGRGSAPTVRLAVTGSSRGVNCVGVQTDIGASSEWSPNDCLSPSQGPCVCVSVFLTYVEKRCGQVAATSQTTRHVQRATESRPTSRCSRHMLVGGSFGEFVSAATEVGVSTPSRRLAFSFLVSRTFTLFYLCVSHFIFRSRR